MALHKMVLSTSRHIQTPRELSADYVCVSKLDGGAAVSLNVVQDDLWDEPWEDGREVWWLSAISVFVRM